jgi:hypothetical protein
MFIHSFLRLLRAPDANAAPAQGGDGGFSDPFSDDDEVNGFTPLEPQTPTGGGDDAGILGPPLGEDAYKTDQPGVKLNADGTPIVAAAPGTPPVTPPTGTENQEQQGEPLSGADQLLYDALGLQNGMVHFEGEEAPVAFSSLTPEEQQNYISDYKAYQATLPTPQERTILEQIRQAGSLPDFIRRNAELARPAQALSDDEVINRYVADNFPNLTPEQQKTFIDQQKGNDFFQAQVNQIRQQYSALEAQRQKEADDKEDLAYATAAQQTQSIANFKINDEVRAFTLEQMLEPSTDDPNTSRFVKELQNPKNLFKAAFLYYQGEKLITHAFKGKQMPTTIESAQEQGQGGQRRSTPQRSTPEVVDLMDS